LSQCSTLFIMRMANDRDQAIVRAAVSDAAANLLYFVPALGTAEVFAFGEGIAMPARLRFNQLPAHLLPNSEAAGRTRMNLAGGINQEFIDSVLERWRGAMLTQKSAMDDLAAAEPYTASKCAPPNNLSANGNTTRVSILKKPLVPGL